MEDSDFDIPLSVFQNKDDNRPQSHTLTWHVFAERLARYDTRDHKDGLAWSPVTYRPGTTRSKANVDTVHALVLDVDHAPLPLDLLEGREYVAHTTFQHTADAPRWRVVLPLTESVAGADWPRFWLRANAYFGGCVDPNTKDASRIFYLPSCPPGAQHEVKQQHGRLLDPEELPEVPEYTPAPRRQGTPSLLNRYLNEWAFRFTKTRVDNLGGMPRDSGRNSACNRTAYLLGGLAADPVHGLEPEDVVELLLQACARNGLIEDDGQRSVEATIRSGLEAGLQRAWSPADHDPQPSNVRSFSDHPRRNGTAAPATGVKLEVTRMSEVQPEVIDWLWRNRFARRKATLMIGDPGLGKSLLSAWVAAQVSTGRDWPDEGTCEQGAAILFTIEDGLADTVAPRLEAAGADRSRIVAVSGVVDLETSMDERMFVLEEHIGLLEELVKREGATFVVFDPISAYLGRDVNAHKETDVRRVLGPLQRMAEKTGVALLLLMHLTKGSGVSALYRATGSIAFPAVCRVVLGVAPDPNDETGKRRLLLPVKFNIAPEATGIGYRIETTKQQILPRADERDQPPVIVWDEEPVLVDATTALDRTGTTQEKGALAECKAALAQILGHPPYRIAARDGERQLKDAGVSTAPNILVQARRELGIKAIKESWAGGWFWELEPKTKLFTRVTREEIPSILPDSSDTADSSKNSQGSQARPEQYPNNTEQLEESSRGRMREAPVEDMRYCPRCGRNLTDWAYEQHLPCVQFADTGELCPVHHKRFDLHECDAL